MITVVVTCLLLPSSVVELQNLPTIPGLIQSNDSQKYTPRIVVILFLIQISDNLDLFVQYLIFNSVEEGKNLKDNEVPHQTL